MAGHLSLDAVPTSPMHFQKYLMKIHHGLSSTDICKMCFLCRDLIPNSELEKIKRGLVLFNQFKKQMLISSDDIGFLVELLEAINRKDLLKMAWEWPAAHKSVGRQFQISRFRYLMFDLAMNCNSDDFEETKHMAEGYMTTNMDNIRDAFHLFTEFEKQDVANKDDVSKLVDILMSNEQLVAKVKHYEDGGHTHATAILSAPFSASPSQSNPQQNQAANTCQWGPATNMQPTRQVCDVPGAPTTQHSHQLPRRPLSNPVMPGLENQLGGLDLGCHTAPSQVSEGNRLKQAPQTYRQLGPEGASSVLVDEALLRRLLAAFMAKFDSSSCPTGIGDGSSSTYQSDMNIETVMDRLIHLDGPDTDPSFDTIGPYNSLEDEGEMPRYPMTRRGLCLIINNMDFEPARRRKIELNDRRGSDVDAVQLILQFRNLGYHVTNVNNRSATDMKELLKSFRKLDHGNYDCFITCILSHGKLGYVYGCDGQDIEIKKLTGLFSGEKCPTLAGKPKMFFIQACQGQGLQCGVQQYETDGPDEPIAMIPNENDFLIGYSTTPGYASFRSTTKGSWYISSLVQAMKLYHKKVDMLNLLALVNRHLGKCCDNKGQKQASSQFNNLTKSLYLV